MVVFCNGSTGKEHDLFLIHAWYERGGSVNRQINNKACLLACVACDIPQYDPRDLIIVYYIVYMCKSMPVHTVLPSDLYHSLQRPGVFHVLCIFLPSPVVIMRDGLLA